MTTRNAYHRLTRVNGQKVHDAYGAHPEGKMISLLAHSRFRRVRFHKVQGTNSPLTHGWRRTGRSDEHNPCD